MKETILVSACLLGTPCRYDGRSKPCECVMRLKEKYDIIPVCPEVAGGLPTPRPPCEIANGKAVRQDGADMSSFYEKGANLALTLAKEKDCKIAVLKENSPSCSPHLRYDGTFSRKLVEGYGITAKLLSENGILVIGESEVDQL